MSAGDVQKSDILDAYNRIEWPVVKLPPDSEQAIQDAAHRAVDALDQLSIECNIALARVKAANARDSAARQENYVEELLKLRNAP